jgi:hypothetical protein
MESLDRVVIIEENAFLQKDTQTEDFAEHFYITRYGRLKGLLMTCPELLIASATKAICDSIAKNKYELQQICPKDRGDAMAWSMNWYQLRTSDNKIFQLSDLDKAKIINNAVELRKPSPLLTQTFIFQRDNSDMLLIAVSLVIDPVHLCLD